LGAALNFIEAVATGQSIWEPLGLTPVSGVEASMQRTWNTGVVKRWTLNYDQLLTHALGTEASSLSTWSALARGRTSQRAERPINEQFRDSLLLLHGTEAERSDDLDRWKLLLLGAARARSTIIDSILARFVSKIPALGHPVKIQAEALCSQLTLALRHFDLTGVPPFAAAIREEGSILIEWAFDDARLSFSLEPEPLESSWSIAKTNGDLACGDMREAPITGILSIFLGKNPM